MIRSMTEVAGPARFNLTGAGILSYEHKADAAIFSQLDYAAAIGG
jgi:hypothetical protein